MTKLHTLYTIIPIEDKCSFMCGSFEGGYFSTSKGNMTSDIKGFKLIFREYETANSYLNCWLDSDKYFVEEFGGNDDLYNIAV